MLSGQLLNSQATLNQYTKLSSIEFVPGSSFDVILQMINTELNIRYFEDNLNATVKFIFPGSNSTDVEVIGEFPFADRAIIKCNVTAAQSETLQGGNFIFEIDQNGDGVTILKGFVQNGLIRRLLGDC